MVGRGAVFAVVLLAVCTVSAHQREDSRALKPTQAPAVQQSQPTKKSAMPAAGTPFNLRNCEALSLREAKATGINKRNAKKPASEREDEVSAEDQLGSFKPGEVVVDLTGSGATHGELSDGTDQPKYKPNTDACWVIRAAGASGPTGELTADKQGDLDKDAAARDGTVPDSAATNTRTAHFNVHALEVEEGHDFLMVYDLRTRKPLVKDTTVGARAEDRFTSNDGLIVWWHTDASVEERGFEAKWEVNTAAESDTAIDLHYDQNTAATHTAEYQQDGVLVTRRGHNVLLTLRGVSRGTFAGLKLVLRGCEKEHTMTLFTLGRPPKSGWRLRSAPVGKEKTAGYSVMLTIPVTAIVGHWDIFVQKKAMKQTTSTSDMPDAGLKVLFNPWSDEDPTYIHSDEYKAAYVQGTRDMYAVFNGHDYGDRSDSILASDYYQAVVVDAVFDRILNHVQCKERGDHVKMTRAILDYSRAQERDELGVGLGEDYKGTTAENGAKRPDGSPANITGILVGRWQATYPNGVGPTAWDGSGQVLEAYYMHYPKPVKYGQCFIFGPLLTTIFRCLGMGARTISSSGAGLEAKPIDAVIDMKYKCSAKAQKGKQQGAGVSCGLDPDRERKDSQWNYHVWTEVWMKRPDYENNRADGWQIMDGADGLVAGPAPKRLVRQGTMKCNWNCDYWVSTTNADVKKYHNGKLTSTDKHSVSRIMVTWDNHVNKSIDVTRTYKRETAHRYEVVDDGKVKKTDAAPESPGSFIELESAETALERPVESVLAEMNAVMGSTASVLGTHDGLEFFMVFTETPTAGKPFTVGLKAKRIGDGATGASSLAVSISVEPTQYNGQQLQEGQEDPVIADVLERMTLPQKTGETATVFLRVTPADYEEYLKQTSSFRFFVTAFPDIGGEGKSFTVDEAEALIKEDPVLETFRDISVRFQGLQITGPKDMKAAAPIRVSFQNPLNVPLTNVVVTARVAGCPTDESTTRRTASLPAKKAMSWSMEIKTCRVKPAATPRVLAVLTASEIPAVHGALTL